MSLRTGRRCQSIVRARGGARPYSIGTVNSWTAVRYSLRGRRSSPMPFRCLFSRKYECAHDFVRIRMTSRTNSASRRADSDCCLPPRTNGLCIDEMSCTSAAVPQDSRGCTRIFLSRSLRQCKPIEYATSVVTRATPRRISVALKARRKRMLTSLMATPLGHLRATIRGPTRPARRPCGDCRMTSMRAHVRNLGTRSTHMHSISETTPRPNRTR